MINQPKVSVVIPVYNGELTLRGSIESILEQTYKNLEIIIVNDGSSDRSAEIIESFNDARIKTFHTTNSGLATTLNFAIAQSTGKYVARQDQDDLALPDRIKKQVVFLESSPNVGLIGTWADIWVDNKSSGRMHRHSTESYSLNLDLLFDNPFVHSSVLMRRATLDVIGLYTLDENRQPPEDYELWSRVSRVAEVANLPEILTIYRELPGSMSRTGISPFVKNLSTISAENITFRSNNIIKHKDSLDLHNFYHGRKNAGGINAYDAFKILNLCAISIAGNPAYWSDEFRNRYRFHKKIIFSRGYFAVLNRIRESFFSSGKF